MRPDSRAQTFESFVDETGRATSVEQLFEVFTRTMGLVGFDRINVSVLRDRDLPETALGFGLINTYPLAWQQQYVDNKLHLIDPVLKWAVGSQRPFRWRDIERELDLSRRQLRFLRQAEDAGLFNGIGIPFAGPASQIGGVALATSGQTPPLVSLDLLTAYANHFYATYKRLTAPTSGVRPCAVELTPREQEILLRLVHGRSNDEIASALGIKPGTVDFHVQNLFRKLGVNTRAAASMQAFTSGLIDR